MIKHIICWLRGCRMIHVEDLCEHAARFKCTRCGVDLAYTRHEGGMVIPYTPDVKEFYERLLRRRYGS